MEGVTFINGSFRPNGEATIDVLDHGLLYGDGIFEGIRAYNGRIFKLDRHLERLFESARAMRLVLPHTASEFADIVLDTCRRNRMNDGYLRLIVTRGRGDLGIDPRSCTMPQVIVIARPQLTFYQDPDRGARLVTSSFRRPSPDTLCPSIKSLNYVNNILARMEATDQGADEALLLDTHGYVAEASVDNIFIVTSRGLITPPTAANLNGVTRQTVIELAEARGLTCREEFFSLFEVWNAREVFMCGTGAEIVPVVAVDRRPIGDGQVGPLTREIVDAYAALVRSSGTPIGLDRLSTALA